MSATPATRLAGTLVIAAFALSAAAADAQQPAPPLEDRTSPQLPVPPWPSLQTPPARSPPLQRKVLRRPAELGRTDDIFLAMELCWRANLPAVPVPGMTIRVLASFTRKGEIFGEPKFTYVTPGVSMETRAVYERAAAAALAMCNPLPFSEALGNAAAGHLHLFEFTDRRNEKGT
jgi:hypothetical protein